MTDTILRTESLCKSYGGKPAVQNLTMQVPKGEIYGFIGQNGAGKSTTFKLLAGLARPTAGEISLFGRPADAAARGRIGILIEDAGLYPGLSARENALLKALALGLPDAGQAVDAVLAQVGLQSNDKKARQLSLGQRRRLGLALALLGNPDLLLLDEPTNGLDPEGIRDIRTLLLALQQERNVTMVISSHILGELEKIATCYGVICQGQMVQAFTAAELAARCSDYLALQTSDPHRAAALLEEKLAIARYEVLPEGTLHIYDAADPATVNTVLTQNGVTVQALGMHRQALEDYFLELMEGKHHD